MAFSLEVQMVDYLNKPVIDRAYLPKSTLIHG